MPSFDDVPRADRLDVVGRRVFLRADLDVPVSEYGAILDDTRLRELLPSIRELQTQKAKVAIGASFGTALAPAPRGTQRAVAERLGELLGAPVAALPDEFARELPFLKEGDVALMPNLARIPGEATDDPRWAFDVARLVDVYVNDAVRASLQRTASVSALPRLMCARGAGSMLRRELRVVYDYAEAVSTPFAAVIGGESVVAREALLRDLVERATSILVGGVVANTFLAAAGVAVGTSQVDLAGLPIAQDILQLALARGVNLRLPVDAVVATRAAPNAPPVYSVRKTNQIGPGDEIVDIAVETCLVYRDVLIRSATVLVCGAMGRCTEEESQSGTLRVLQAATEASRYSLLVGDRTVAIARLLRQDSLFRDISLGGEASLALLRGSPAPGIESLRIP